MAGKTEYETPSQALARKVIVQKRRNKGLTQEDVALEMGIDRSYLTQLENGNKPINLKHLDQLSVILNCHVKDFFPSEKYNQKEESSVRFRD